MTQWRATAAGMLRWCQYCQHSEGQGVYNLRHVGHGKPIEHAMEYEFKVRKKTETAEVAVVAEDGLEAVSLAYPDLDFETMDVAGDTTFVLDTAGNAIYIAVRGNPVG